jgi:hypothetical protein
MTLLTIILAFWLTSCILRGVREWKARKAEQKRSAELERMSAEWKAQKAQAELETKRLIAIEREQIRQAKEQERQAAILEKHEKRIELLEYKVRKLDRDIEAQNELLADYYAQLDWLLLQQSGTVSGGSEFAKWQNKIVTKNNQIRKAECKLEDMNDAKERAEKEMEVA